MLKFLSIGYSNASPQSGGCAPCALPWTTTPSRMSKRPASTDKIPSKFSKRQKSGFRTSMVLSFLDGRLYVSFVMGDGGVLFLCVLFFLQPLRKSRTRRE